MAEKIEFPKDFLWGSATSAYQIEGNNKNCDWWEWEQKGGGAEPSGIACNSYNRYKEDFDLAKNLNQNAQRISIEWSRIEPEEGKFSDREIKHYANVLKSLKEKGFKTFVTLHHFTSPIWFSKKGGWLNLNSPKMFSKYVKHCAENLDKLADFWITINEPTVYTGHSYIKGIWPPQKRSLILAAFVYINLARAHIASYKILKKNTTSPVGFAHNVPNVKTQKPNIFSQIIAIILNFAFTDLFFLLSRLKIDFIGLNYYFEYRISGLKTRFDYSNGKVPYINWPIAPEGILHVLSRLKKYKKPIYITENGTADSEDYSQKDFIKNHLYYINEAMKKGADVRGYLYWSLIDNYEWNLGYKPKFGLIAIDRGNSLKRIIRKSGIYYSKICKESGVEI